MRDWHHQRRTDLALRLGGASLCGLSFLAIRTLAQFRSPSLPAPPGVAAFALAAVGFLWASAGAALLTLGHHIFDEIEIGERWQQRPPARTHHDRLNVATSNDVGDADATDSMSSLSANWEQRGAAATHPRG